MAWKEKRNKTTQSRYSKVTQISPKPQLLPLLPILLQFTVQTF